MEADKLVNWVTCRRFIVKVKVEATISSADGDCGTSGHRGNIAVRVAVL